MSNTEQEHALVSIETNEHASCRWVCACGERGWWVRDVGHVMTGEEWARSAHKNHVSRQVAIANGERPASWG